MKIIEKFEEVRDLLKTPNDIQKDINVAEVWHLWNILVARYDVVETTDVLINFCEDTDLKSILTLGKSTLQKQIDFLEKYLNKSGIPLPPRPPKFSSTTVVVDVVTDKYIYRRVLGGIQSFLPVHMVAYTQTTSSIVREKVKAFLLEEISLFDSFLEYGKLKGWVAEPPHFRVS